MIEERVLKCIESVIFEEPKLTDDFIELEIDSIDVIDIVVQLEIEFDIHIPDRYIPELHSVEDCVKLITTLTQ